MTVSAAIMENVSEGADVAEVVLGHAQHRARFKPVEQSKEFLSSLSKFLRQISTV